MGFSVGVRTFQERGRVFPCFSEKIEGFRLYLTRQYVSKLHNGKRRDRKEEKGRRRTKGGGRVFACERSGSSIKSRGGKTEEEGDLPPSTGEGEDHGLHPHCSSQSFSKWGKW